MPGVFWLQSVSTGAKVASYTLISIALRARIESGKRSVRSRIVGGYRGLKYETPPVSSSHSRKNNFDSRQPTRLRPRNDAAERSINCKRWQRGVPQYEICSPCRPAGTAEGGNDTNRVAIGYGVPIDDRFQTP